MPFMERRKMMKVVRIQQGDKIVEAAMIDEHIYMLPQLAYQEAQHPPGTSFGRLVYTFMSFFVIGVFLGLCGLGLLFLSI